MTLEQRIEDIEKRLSAIETRHMAEDEEIKRIRAAMTQAAKSGIALLSEQAK